MVFAKQSLRALGLFLLFCCITPVCYAGSAQYLYDNLGRLRAVGDGGANFATYDYDEVGNLLSISSATANPNPPVIQGINPTVFFIGSTTPISIVGQNFLTIKEIVADNPYLYTKILKTTDTEIRAEVTVASQALPASTKLTLASFYGSVNIQAELTSSKLSLGPSLLTLSPGSSGIITASIYPALAKSISLQINNSDLSIISAPQSIVIPAAGTVTFSVTALKAGTVYVGSGVNKATVQVTTDIFAPLAGEGLTSASYPVSIYIDNPSNAAIQTGLPASVSIDAAQSNASLLSPLYSVSINSAADNCVPSSPISMAIDQATGNTFQPSLPVSVSIDQATSNAIQQSIPVSMSIDAIAGDTTAVSMPVSTKISPP